MLVYYLFLDYDINWRNNVISFNFVVTITSQMSRMFAFVNLTRYTHTPPNKARRFRWKGTTGPRIIDKSALEGRAHPSPSSALYVQAIFRISNDTLASRKSVPRCRLWNMNDVRKQDFAPQYCQDFFYKGLQDRCCLREILASRQYQTRCSHLFK